MALSKNDSKNIKELIARVLNAICKFPELRGIVVQQGGSKALLPLALEGTNKGKRHAAQALARIGISQDPAIAFPGQRVSNKCFFLYCYANVDLSFIRNSTCNAILLNRTHVLLNRTHSPKLAKKAT